jgi:SAM-dependent methyltransferase
MSSREAPPSVRAFDKIAAAFDERFGAWHSVAAQRDAVRRYLARIFPPGSRLLELGGGTGEDAVHFARLGYRVTVTDGSPGMVERAADKLRRAGIDPESSSAERLVLEDMKAFARRRAVGRYDGAYSNFAALNCVENLHALAAPLARLVRPGGACGFVMFGPCSIGELVVEVARGRPRAALRRLSGGAAPARLSGESFTVWYPSPRAVARSLRPYFRLRAIRGIGILVPPSAAEPWISSFPRVVRSLAVADRLLTAPLALLADHVLLDFERTVEPAPDL